MSTTHSLLETERLILRHYSGDDVDAFLPILSDPTTMSFWPRPFVRQDVQNWIDRSIANYAQYGFGRYVVLTKASQTIIGDCGIGRLSVAGEVVNDLGYIIHHPYWRQGYATEAARAVKDYAFSTLQLDALHANMPWDHAASRSVAESIGMRLVKEFLNERNRNIRTCIYTITNPDAPTA
jgi:ribosomal-protein-alanine N-acetyltransferase